MISGEELKKISDFKLTKDIVFSKCKEELALMLVLWKYFKSQPPDGDYMWAFIMAKKYAEAFGIVKEFEDLVSKTPKIKFSVD